MDYKKNRVSSLLSDELKVNPFIRFNDPALDQFRLSLKESLNTEYERWRVLMTIH